MLAKKDRPQILASVLTADFSELGQECLSLQEAGIDAIHWDIMDGIAVPGLSFGPDIIKSCRDKVEIPFEAHLMSRDPDPKIEALADAGCRLVTIHPDWLAAPRRTIQRVADAGMAVGLALSPGTSPDFAFWHTDMIKKILIMSVEPGYGGQKHIKHMVGKVQIVADHVATCAHEIIVEMDGGITPATLVAPWLMGATEFVVGSYLWRAPSFSKAVARLQERPGTDTQ